MGSEALRGPTDEQSKALEHAGNVVLFAGPGSGKTRTLIEKAALDLGSSSRFRRVACITYTNAAANEIVSRLNRRGLDTDRVFAGTVHAFCLQEIIMPDRRLDAGSQQALRVMNDKEMTRLLERSYQAEGIFDLDVQYRQGEVTRIRRASFLGEDLQEYDDREVRAIARYEAAIRRDELIDFESILQEAVRLLKTQEATRYRLAVKFESVLVDEYQDLGGVLHELVRTLADQTRVRLFCVGDPNQSIFGFAGASPRYMRDLASRDDFEKLELTINFRSHPDIVAASGAILAASSVGESGRYSEGAVRLHIVEGWLDDHAKAVAAMLEQAVASGRQLGEYAVLYPRRGELVNLLEREFERRGLSFVYERRANFPDGPIAEFVRSCASKAVLRAELEEANPSDVDSFTLRGMRSLSYDDLARRYRRLSGATAGLSDLSQFQLSKRLAVSTARRASDLGGSAWLSALISQLRLDVIAAASDDPRDRASLSAIEAFLISRDDNLPSIADEGLDGKSFVLTTFHTAKGREFDNVIIPGLVNGTVPGDVKRAGSWGLPVGDDLDEARRAFYVALSRARKSVALIAGTIGGPEWRRTRRGVSVFVTD